MTIVTDTRPAPAAWAVKLVRDEQAAKLNAFDAECAKNRFNPHGWSQPTAPYILSEDEVMAEAAARQARREAYLASPQGRVYLACRELEEVGSEAEADRIRSAIARSGHGPSISARECGVILETLDGMNTSTARAIVAAVAENLRVL